jgi:hypothetical protein
VYSSYLLLTKHADYYENLSSEPVPSVQSIGSKLFIASRKIRV